MSPPSLGIASFAVSRAAAAAKGVLSGKKARRARVVLFASGRAFGGWAGFHDSLICAGSKGGGRDLTAGGECAEWSVDMTGPDGPILWNEILSRRWRSGKVVSERYSTAT